MRAVSFRLCVVPFLRVYIVQIEDKFHLEFETYNGLNDESIKSGSKRARVDLLLKYRGENNSTTAAIELKFFKKENHREPNNRYDVFRDIALLEQYKKNGIDLCYFLLATDHSHYYNQNKYSADTADFDFRSGKEYKAETMLSYRTQIPYGKDICLSRDYEFLWNKINDLYFLKIKV